MALNAYQTMLNQTAAKRALSGEEQERLRQIAAQQGAGAASSLALQMANSQKTTDTPPITGGATTPTNTGGATGGSAQAQAAQARAAEARQQAQAQQERNRIMTSGTVQERNALLQRESMQRNIEMAQRSGNTQAAAQMQQAMEAQERARILSSGNQQQINQYLIEQSRKQAQQQNPYQAAGAAATPAGNAANAGHGLSNAPTINGNYIWYGWMGDNNMTTMTDEDKANWNTAMAGWQKGDYSAFNDNFQKAGNWSSYVDDKGNVNGMLRYVGDGIGGYVPVNGGQLLQNGFSGDMGNYAFYGPDGSVYTADSSGRLTKAGTWTADYDQVMKNGYYYNNPDRYFVGKDGKYYTYGGVPDDKLEEWGYVRRSDGIFYEPQTIATNNALKNGDITPEQLAMAQAMRNAGNIPGGNVPSANTPSSTTGGGGSYYGSSSQTTPTQAQPIQNQPVQTQPVQTQPTQASPNIYQQYMDQWDYPEAPQWEGSEYQQKRDDALKRAEDMRWNYDPNTDPVWQALQKQYRREGDRATQEALAQAAMRTGGIANSYAVTAASQAGDYYAAQLSDRLPQLYQDAYNRYLQEFQRQMGISDQYQGFDDREYSRFGDRLQQYNTDRNFDYGRYRDAVGDVRYADETAYNRNYQAQRDAILDNRADREWAQQLREYADAQNWKATEWQQYLREYGDKMNQQEREWAYQQYRDAVGDERYADQTAYQRALYDQEYADQRNDTAWEQGYKQTAYNDEMERSALNYLNTNGIVTGRYAEILGVPDGTTYEQYYSRYLGGGNSSPFEETEIPSGTTPTDTPLPDDNPPGDTPPGDTPPDDTGNGRTWWNGRPMTDTAYDLQSRIAYGWAQKTLTKENVQRMVYDAARKGYIEDYEIPLLMRIIGVNIQGPPQQNPNVEGPIAQWTK